MVSGVPPFERFYESHKGEVLAFLRRRAGRDRADERPALEELAPLTDDLPPKERAAVVLRYGYDLDYDTIGAALGSNEQAARQAASAGVRRLRKEKEQR